MTDLGSRIRERRRESELTLAQLAERTGFSASYLSQVERNLTNPSVPALKRISDALGVLVASFFEEQPASSGGQPVLDPGEHGVVVRRTQRKAIMYPGSNIRHELLSPDLQHQMEFIWISAPPGTSSGDLHFQHKGEECGFVIQGQMEFQVGDRTYMLEEGDAIYFPSHQIHGWRNPGDRDLVLVWCTTPPAF